MSATSQRMVDEQLLLGLRVQRLPETNLGRAVVEEPVVGRLVERSERGGREEQAGDQCAQHRDKEDKMSWRMGDAKIARWRWVMLQLT